MVSQAHFQTHHQSSHCEVHFASESPVKSHVKNSIRQHTIKICVQRCATDCANYCANSGDSSEICRHILEICARTNSYLVSWNFPCISHFYNARQVTNNFRDKASTICSAPRTRRAEPVSRAGQLFVERHKITFGKVTLKLSVGHEGKCMRATERWCHLRNSENAYLK